MVYFWITPPNCLPLLKLTHPLLKHFNCSLGRLDLLVHQFNLHILCLQLLHYFINCSNQTGVVFFIFCCCILVNRGVVGGEVRGGCVGGGPDGWWHGWWLNWGVRWVSWWHGRWLNRGVRCLSCTLFFFLNHTYKLIFGYPYSEGQFCLKICSRNPLLGVHERIHGLSRRYSEFVLLG